MSPDFVRAFTFAMKWEGSGYEDVSGDAGGPTRSGITWTDGNRWRSEHGLTPISIEAARKTKLDYLTEPIIQQIYASHYWTPIHGDEVPNPTDWVLFDAAVNCGVGQAVKWLQRELGVTDDGAFGPMTLAAARKYVSLHGQRPLCTNMLTRRSEFYHHIATKGSNGKFLHGWLSRVNDLKTAIEPLLTP